MPHETTIVMNSARLKFGPGATREVGYDMRQLGGRRIMVVTDLMGADTSHARPEEAGDLLAGTIVALMRRTGMPNGLAAVGYTAADVDTLVAGALSQQRLTRLSPRPVEPADLRQMFLASLQLW